MEQKYAMTLLDKKTNQVKTYDIRTGEVISVDGVLAENTKFLYSLEIGDAICNLVRGGMTLTEVSRVKGMPALCVIYRWREIHPEFKQRLDIARSDKGDYYHDKAVEVLEDIETKDDVPVGKLKFEGYMKLAEKNNPDRYQQKGAGVAAGALQIIVNTGIVREDQPVTVEVKDVGQETDSGRGEQLNVCGSEGTDQTTGSQKGEE
jgi:hypothetical protein